MSENITIRFQQLYDGAVVIAGEHWTSLRLGKVLEVRDNGAVIAPLGKNGELLRGRSFFVRAGGLFLNAEPKGDA